MSQNSQSVTIIRKPEVRARTGLSDSQIWRLEARGEFPARVSLGTMAVGWHLREVIAWVESRPRVGGKQPPLPKRRREQRAAH
jgi:prophage regulatory protein